MLINEIKSLLKFNGSLGIVLGSGLDHIVDFLNDKIILPYSEIDSFPLSTVDGHKGELISGYFLEKQILIARGRLHLYEGIKKEEVIMPIELFHDLGVKNIIITNSSGSLRLDNKPGSIMLIDGHYDCTFLDSSKLPDLKEGDKYYKEDLVKLVFIVAKKNNIELLKGKYCWMHGPAYETPAEIQFLQKLGGDAVGMSTLPEVEAAKKNKMSTLVLSVLTNYAAGLDNKTLKHEDVLLNAKKAQKNFIKLVKNIILDIGTE